MQLAQNEINDYINSDKASGQIKDRKNVKSHSAVQSKKAPKLRKRALENMEQVYQLGTGSIPYKITRARITP
jgi:hypothetical protein